MHTLDQANPANYRPVIMPVHARKTVDATLLTYVCDHVTRARTKFGFQLGINVQQMVLQAHANAQRGITHVAELDLEKVYDRVDPTMLLLVVAEHMEGSLLHMVGATLGPIPATTKGDPKNCWADITTGLPKVHAPPLSLYLSPTSLPVPARS